VKLSGETKNTRQVDWTPAGFCAMLYFVGGPGLSSHASPAAAIPGEFFVAPDLHKFYSHSQPVSNSP
jgi:hypothetical protein